MGEKLNRALLIELVRTEPALWNKTHKSYNNRDLKQELWENIGKSLNTTAKMAQKAWSTLRDSYKKILKRIYCNQTSKQFVSWPYFQAISFLDEVNTDPREQYMNAVGANDNDSNSGNDRQSDEEESSSEEEDEEDDSSSEESIGRKRKYEDDQDYPMKAQFLESYYYPEQRNFESDDDYFFLMSLHPYLKKMEDSQKMKVRIDMLRCVSDEMMNARYLEGLNNAPQQPSTSDQSGNQRQAPVSSSANLPS